MSIQAPPGRNPASTPSAASTTAATAAGEGRQVITLSACAATSPRRCAPGRAGRDQAACAVALEIMHDDCKSRSQQAPGEVGA